MKKSILKGIVVILIVLLFAFGLLPNVNNYLKLHITYEVYTVLIIALLFATFEIILYLKLNDKIKLSFKRMKESIDFNRYKKEEKYIEDKNFYYRDFPFDKNLFKIFWIAFQYEIIDNRANILNALLLKWCKENRIKFISKGKYEILDKEMAFDDENEASLFYMLINKNKNKFIKLTMFNSSDIFQKINDILLIETNEFRKENKIVRNNGEDIILSTIKPEVDIVFGFKNFILNYGSLKNMNPEQVKLWEEYLIYAELLGVSDKVKKEFRKMNIDYSFRETRFKKINRGMISFLKLLLCISYLFYSVLLMLLTFLIGALYVKLTW